MFIATQKAEYQLESSEIIIRGISFIVSYVIYIAAHSSLSKFTCKLGLGHWHETWQILITWGYTTDIIKHTNFTIEIHGTMQ